MKSLRKIESSDSIDELDACATSEECCWAEMTSTLR